MTDAEPRSPLPTSLSTARLELGPWHDDDLEPYAAMVHERDPRARRAPRDGHPTRDELREQVAAQRRAFDAPGLGLYAIRVEGTFVGYCGLVVGQSTPAEPELAYELLQAHHGRGYATEAAAAVVDTAAGAGHHRLWATVRRWNDASFRVLDKVGFDRTDRVTTDDFGDSVWCRRDL